MGFSISGALLLTYGLAVDLLRKDIIGMSLSEPHIDHDNGATCRIMLSIYLCTCMYHLPRVCHTLIPAIRVCPKMLCVHVFRCIDLLTCIVYNCMHLTKQQG